MSFFDSIHCKSGAHCRTCRDRERGSGFRRSVHPLGETNWECPHDVPWGHDGPAGIAPLRQSPYPVHDPYRTARNAIMRMDGGTEEGRFLHAMLAQLEHEVRTRRFSRCKDRKAFRKRQREKLVYLYKSTMQASHESEHAVV